MAEVGPNQVDVAQFRSKSGQPLPVPVPALPANSRVGIRRIPTVARRHVQGGAPEHRPRKPMGMTDLAPPPPAKVQRVPPRRSAAMLLSRRHPGGGGPAPFTIGYPDYLHTSTFAIEAFCFYSDGQRSYRLHSVIQRSQNYASPLGKGGRLPYSAAPQRFAATSLCDGLAHNSNPVRDRVERGECNRKTCNEQSSSGSGAGVVERTKAPAARHKCFQGIGRHPQDEAKPESLKTNACQ